MFDVRRSPDVTIVLFEVFMRRLMQTVALALAGAAVTACAPHPIVARDPQPPPSPAEAYDCGTTRLPLNAAFVGCSPREREERMILRSRG